MERIETLDDVKRWIAANDARINVFWDAQHKRNDAVDRKFHGFRLRLEAVEKRMIFWCGIASAVGSMGGALGALVLPKLF